ncbi:MAG: hypothetical protein MJA83_16790 [Gammaproteobacteria bacterium]|nr:hypothetical protein [Gammaproteobacteria bacterium]
MSKLNILFTIFLSAILTGCNHSSTESGDSTTSANESLIENFKTRRTHPQSVPINTVPRQFRGMWEFTGYCSPGKPPFSHINLDAEFQLAQEDGFGRFRDEINRRLGDTIERAFKWRELNLEFIEGDSIRAIEEAGYDLCEIGPESVKEFINEHEPEHFYAEVKLHLDESRGGEGDVDRVHEIWVFARDSKGGDKGRLIIVTRHIGGSQDHHITGPVHGGVAHGEHK